MATASNVVVAACRVFDAVERGWESPRTRQGIGTVLVTLFVLVLGIVELARQQWLPASLLVWVPRSHFTAVGVVFTLLLVLEVAGLVFALPRSVAESLGKQFELLALILIREAFIEIGNASEPLAWNSVRSTLPHIAADMLGALIVFGLLVPFQRVQRHRAITSDARDQASFVCAKKLLALVLLIAFLYLGLLTLARHLRSGDGPPFFISFYTILVLSDVLLVLVSLRYSTTFRVVFRNAAFAAATVLIRVALTAPPYVNGLLATGAAIFALGTSIAYNAWEDDRRAPPV